MTKREENHKMAVSAFIEKVEDSKEKLEKIQAHLDNFMNTSVEDVTFSNVGDAGHLNEELSNLIKFLGL